MFCVSVVIHSLCFPYFLVTEQARTPQDECFASECERHGLKHSTAIFQLCYDVSTKFPPPPRLRALVSSLRENYRVHYDILSVLIFTPNIFSYVRQGIKRCPTMYLLLVLRGLCFTHTYSLHSLRARLRMSEMHSSLDR